MPAFSNLLLLPPLHLAIFDANFLTLRRIAYVRLPAAAPQSGRDVEYAGRTYSCFSLYLRLPPAAAGSAAGITACITPTASSLALSQLLRFTEKSVRDTLI